MSWENASKLAAKRKSRTRAFTLLELMVVLGIAVVLLSVFVPYAMSWRESSLRFRCADNLRLLKAALDQYAQQYGGTNERYLPRVRFDEKSIGSPNFFTGPDASDPFAEGSDVKPNDVTASLWLLVRTGIVPADRTAMFLCPSAGGQRELLTDANGRTVPLERRSNFRSPRSLGYGYADPFGPPEYKLTDTLPGGFVLLADAGPATSPPSDTPPLVVSAGNSPNHGRAGQNVLFADGSVQWLTHPYVGVGYTAASPRSGDHIYGPVAPTTAPSYAYDSVLLPNKE